MVFGCIALSAGSGAAYNTLFSDRTDYNVGDHPTQIIAVDVDGDSDLDLVITDQGGLAGGNDYLSVLINDGDGQFLSAADILVGEGPFSLCSADFDHDGDYDLAVANRISSNLMILINTGAGTFVSTDTYGVGISPDFVGTGDFDGDGYTDLAVANSISMNVSVLINKRDGTFKSRVNYAVSGGAYAVVTADFDNDGDDDLAIGTDSGIDILFNNGAGTFQVTNLYEVQAFTMIADDFNGDNIWDLASASTGSDSIAIMLGRGDGTFERYIDFATGDLPSSFASGDFDRDGDRDLAVVDNLVGRLSVYINDGSGHFTFEGHYKIGNRPESVCAADLDGDGDWDLAATNNSSNTVSIYFNQTHTGRSVIEPRSVVAVRAFDPAPPGMSIFVGDFDDGQSPADIDPFSVRINDSIFPSSFVVESGHAGIPGQVLRMDFSLKELIETYRVLRKVSQQIYRVEGQFGDGTPFRAGGNVTVVGFIKGDANLDGDINIGDPVFLINYLYHSGPAPFVEEVADANNDSSIEIGDAVSLINYIFKDGPPPSPASVSSADDERK
jgi:FG-GAP-like repeat/Dockerin type I domain